jgi:hypothetical protein
MTRRAAAAANTAAIAIAAAAATVPPAAHAADDGATAAAAASGATADATAAAGASADATAAAAAAATRAAALAHLFPPIAFAPRLPRPPEEMLRVVGAPPVFVGGTAIGGAPPPPPPLEQQQPRGRGKRGRKRAPRAPARCESFKSLGRPDEEQRTCRGARGKASPSDAFFCVTVWFKHIAVAFGAFHWELDLFFFFFN